MRNEIAACQSTFQVNRQSVDNLFTIHGTLTGGVQGKNKHLTPSLLKSSIVFLCASWETFIEDICRTGTSIMVDNISNVNNYPVGIRTRVANDLKASKHNLEIWKISGDGWKGQVLEKVEKLCDGSKGGLNTPSYNNIKSLLEETLSITDLKKNWRWNGMTPDGAAKKLNEIIAMRGEIAHGKNIPGLNINHCKDYSNHIDRLVQATCTHVDSHIKQLIA